MHPSHTPPAGRHDVGLDESATVERTHPTAVLRRAGDAVVLDLGWTGHLQVPDDTSEAISAAEMEALLPGLRKGAAEYIVPQATPGTPPEMRYFDPNRCGCLDWSKKYPPGSRWAYMPAWSGGAGCRRDASHRLLRFSRDRKGVTKRGTRANEVEEAHVAVTSLSNTFGNESRYSISATRCPDGNGRCILFDYHRRIACGPAWQREWTTVDYSWLEALDPHSYGLWQDHEAKSTLWCSDPTCTNYYRYLERSLVRKCCGFLGGHGNGRDPFGLKGSGVWRIKGVPYRTHDSDIILARQGDLKLMLKGQPPTTIVCQAPKHTTLTPTPRKEGVASSERPSRTGRTQQTLKPAKQTVPKPKATAQRVWRKLTHVFSTPWQRLARLSAAEATRAKWSGKEI